MQYEIEIEINPEKIKEALDFLKEEFNATVTNEILYMVVVKGYFFGYIPFEEFHSHKEYKTVNILSDSKLLGSPHAIGVCGPIAFIDPKDIRLANRQDFENFRYDPEHYDETFCGQAWVWDKTEMEVKPFPEGIFQKKEAFVPPTTG